MEEVYETSEFAKERLKTSQTKLYPFEQLKQGLSFFVKFDEVEERSFRALVSTNSRKLNRNFKCIKNTEFEAFEVTEIVNEKVIEFQIVQCSEDARKVQFNSDKERTAIFNALPEGLSYILNIADVDEKIWKSACSKSSKRLATKFILLKHEQYDKYELYHARKDQQQLSFFEPSLEAAGIKNGN